MFTLKKLRRAQDRHALLQEFPPTETTWLVSDLRSKFEIQNQIMAHEGYFEDLMVLRASELWTLLLRRERPQWKKVSRDFIRTWIREQIRQDDKASPGVEDLLLDLMDEFAPVLVHDAGLEVFNEWLATQSGLQARLSPWFQRSSELFRELVGQGSISPRWMAALLTSIDSQWERHWSRPLVIDLGVEFSIPESELLQRLAQHLPIVVIEPQLPQESRFFYLKKPYEQLRGENSTANNGEGKSGVRGEFHRLTSPLAEVKFATAKIREWLEAGVEPENIGLIAPNIEEYWPMIEAYFREEGIPVAKDSTTRLQAFAGVQTWLSKMRTAQHSFEYSDLENSIFSRSDELPARFERFEGLFKNLLDFGDLARDPAITGKLQLKDLPKGSLTTKQALAWMLEWWPREEAWEPLEPIFREMLEPANWTEGASSTLTMELSQWIFWAERATGRLEMRVRIGDRRGVQFENLTAADSGRLRFRIFLGLTESQLQANQRGLLSPSEVEKLFLDTGFHCPHPEQSSLHYELEWLAENPSEQDLFCTSQASVSGAPEAPHPFWLAHQSGQVVSTVPGPTRWDALAAQKDLRALAASRNWDSEQVIRIQNQVQRDQTGQGVEAIHGAERVLSPSQLETYHDCPFKFAAGSLFRLLDESEVDLDPDQRSAGNLVHKMLEELGREPRRNWTDQELRAGLDEWVKNITIGEQQLWPSWREKLVRLGQRFLRFETDLRKSSIGSVKTLAVEKKFEVELEGRQWRLTMDRVDQIAGRNLVVYDYKPSDRTYSPGSWKKQNHSQVAFYSWLIDRKKLEEWKELDLYGAYYYVYRSFRLRGANREDTKNYAKLTDNLDWVEGLIKEFVAALNAGEFPARPQETTTCNTCNWSQLCRAPHLNQ